MTTASVSLRQRVGVFFLLFGLLAALAPVALASPAFANGNPPATECGEFNFVVKYDRGGSGWSPTFGVGFSDSTPGVTLDDLADQNSGSWTSSVPIARMVVKAGSASEVTDYSPLVLNGTYSNVGVGGAGSDGESDAGISHITFCTGTVQDPELELLKVWQAEDGTPISPVTDDSWSASVEYGNGDSTGIGISGSTVSDSGSFDSSRTRYSVVEPSGDGFAEVDCSPATEARIASAYDDGRDVDYRGTGTFAAPVTDTLHVLCNEVVEEEPEEPTVTLNIVKQWEGDAQGDASISVTNEADATNSYDLNVTRDMTLLQGQTFILEEEEPEGLSSNCRVVSSGMALGGDAAGGWVDHEDRTYPYTDPEISEGSITDTITVTNDVDCTTTTTTTTPDPEPDTYDITFAKDWAGDVNGVNPGPTVNTGNVTVEFTVALNGEVLEGTFAPGDVLEVEEGDDVEITGETHSQLNPNFCEAAIALPGALTDVSSDGTLTVINSVDCAEVLAEVIEQPEEKPVPEPETEVLAEVETLPETGASALLLTLMGLLSIGVGGGMIGTRKRS